MAESRIPPGASLLLIGSGLYWILSSQLISSFTVLTPGLFQADELGGSLITVVGVVSATAGRRRRVSYANRSLDQFSDCGVESIRLLRHRDRSRSLDPLHHLISRTITRTRSVHAQGRLIPFRSVEVLQISSIRLHLRSSRFWTG